MQHGFVHIFVRAAPDESLLPEGLARNIMLGEAAVTETNPLE